jgi:hypothetical protein
MATAPSEPDNTHKEKASSSQQLRVPIYNDMDVNRKVLFSFYVFLLTNLLLFL